MKSARSLPLFTRSACALATLAALGAAQAQPATGIEAPSSTAPAATPETTVDTVVVTAKRERRVSKGATNLRMEAKDTPQSISTLDRETLRDFATTGTHDALRLGTGITVDEWETNRTNYSARGFDIMLTQVDGLGMANDWGLVVGQQDTYLFESIELIRGANGLLTGVGNASGTINYVRKRPTNRNGGEVVATGGSNGLKRLAVDYNQVLSEDGRWAGRLVAAHEDKDSHLRDLHDRRSSVYGVVEGQISQDGVLTAGLSHGLARQRSPMWGSLTLRRADGSQAAYDVSASTSQDWTRWNTQTTQAFVEYTHALGTDWEAKAVYSHAQGQSDTKLFYAYSLTGQLEQDGTGLYGWPYRSEGESSSRSLDLSLSGRFGAWGRQHEAVVGVNHSRQSSMTEAYAVASAPSAVLPAFPYDGDVYAEPAWGAKSVAEDGDQRITRLYAATRLQLGERLKGVLGLNAIDLRRDGTSIYGGGVALENETTRKLSPYVGATYDLSPEALAYASYSDIYQAQDQRDVQGRFLAPMKGLNAEVGLKAEWLDRRLLTTVALFSARQKGLATEAGFDPVSQQSYYTGKDVDSRGLELEASGRVSADTRVSAGLSALRLTGPDGQDIYEWVPRRTLKLRADTRLSGLGLPQLRVGAGARWQSAVSKSGGAHQGAYSVADAFAAYELSPVATVRVNLQNLFNTQYLRTVQYGAIYGAPRTGSVSLEYKI
ncbi:TonB-dependent siderophore receptor [Ideonella livida]|uniref:TonB-dependent siderophore receptor n=1 Tax=Ideonella livida TaxID=2707176 RepID=A0A7C9TGW9_9BURK|nr:TonB-dependent siderophore receptor [Ideonella livida]NDY90119.1 TonB-dependent siderophore receptor [Ideonella livida]